MKLKKKKKKNIQEIIQDYIKNFFCYSNKTPSPSPTVEKTIETFQSFLKDQNLGNVAENIPEIQSTAIPGTKPPDTSKTLDPSVDPARIFDPKNGNNTSDEDVDSTHDVYKRSTPPPLFSTTSNGSSSVSTDSNEMFMNSTKVTIDNSLMEFFNGGGNDDKKKNENNADNGRIIHIKETTTEKSFRSVTRNRDNWTGGVFSFVTESSKGLLRPLIAQLANGANDLLCAGEGSTQEVHHPSWR